MTPDRYANLSDEDVRAAVETLRAAGVETVARYTLDELDDPGQPDTEIEMGRALLVMRADLLRAEKTADRYRIALAIIARGSSFPRETASKALESPHGCGRCGHRRLDHDSAGDRCDVCECGAWDGAT